MLVTVMVLSYLEYSELTHERLELEADVLSLVLSHAIQCLSRRAKEAIHYDVSPPP